MKLSDSQGKTLKQGSVVEVQYHGQLKRGKITSCHPETGAVIRWKGTQDTIVTSPLFLQTWVTKVR